MNAAAHPVKLAVSGTHSTGKTSALKRALRELQGRGYCVAYVGDIARRCPLPILRQHTAQSSLWIAATTLTEELQLGHSSEIVLVDRPVLDALAYYLAALKHRHEQSPQGEVDYELLRHLVSSWMTTYQQVFHTRIDPSRAIEDDKSRDLDPAFRRDVEAILGELRSAQGVSSTELTSDETANARLIADAAVQLSSARATA